MDTADVDLRLNWVIAGNHAPFFLAAENGYWQDCGLNVNITGGQGSSDTATLVANGDQEFGLSDAVSVAAGRSRGLEIKSLGVLYQSNPGAFVSNKESGITSLEDLSGKTFGTVPGASPYLLATALIEEHGIENVKEVSIPSPGIAQLKTGQVDFITFFANEVANVDPDPEQNLNVMPFSDYGQDIYGLTLVSSDDYIEEHPAQVDCFVGGVRKGFEEAEAQPDGALDALAQAAPETGAAPDVHEQLLEGALEYAGDDLFAQTEDKWQSTVEVLRQAGIVKSNVEPSALFTAAGSPS